MLAAKDEGERACRIRGKIRLGSGRHRAPPPLNAMPIWARLDPELVRRALRVSPSPASLTSGRRAAVAALLAESPNGVELLLIRRAERASDPWSGHMALPGGHLDPSDADLRATAVRETREELGIDLERDAQFLGRLQDFQPHLSRWRAPSFRSGSEHPWSPAEGTCAWLHGRARQGATRLSTSSSGAGGPWLPRVSSGGKRRWGLTYASLASGPANESKARTFGLNAPVAGPDRQR